MKNKTGLFLTAILAMALMMAGCGSSADSNQQTGSQSAGETGFVFTSGDTKVVMNAKAADILESLGKETDYFEAESCAFKGIDKTYTYPGFRLYTYPVDEVDMFYLWNLRMTAYQQQKASALATQKKK